MKLLLINYEFPPLGGGAGNATKNIAKEIAILGQEVVVLTTFFQGLKEDEFIDGYRIIRLRSLRKKKYQSNIIEMISFVLSAIFFLRTFIRIWKPEKVISFFSIPSGIVAYYLKRKFNIDYIISLRGGDVPGFNVNSKTLDIIHQFTLPVNKIIWGNSNHIVANSVGLRELAEKTAVEVNKKVEIIDNGIDLSIFYPGTNKINSKIRILFVGRLNKQKRVVDIIKAINIVIKKKKDSKNKIDFLIIGDGPEKSALEELTNNLGLNNIIKFYGWVDRNLLPDEYRESDIFVSPSTDEGMPNTILEALASGLPIITSNVSGNRELVIDNINGFVINNIEELPETLEKIIESDELRKKFGQESLIISKSYSWKEAAMKYIELIE